jgi:hypothetical protein
MNWWEPWVGQGYNVQDLVQAQTGGSPLPQDQWNALMQYFVGGEQDMSILTNVQGTLSEGSATPGGQYYGLPEYDPASGTQGEIEDMWSSSFPGGTMSSEQLGQSETYGPMWQNVQNMIAGGTNQADIYNYIQSLGLSSNVTQQLTDSVGGGGVGGTAAKNLFYPQQQTGFAGLGEGMNKPMQSTLDNLLKVQGKG